MLIGIIVIVIGIYVYNCNVDLVEVVASLISVGASAIIAAVIKLIYDGEIYYNKIAEKAYKRIKCYAKTVRYNHTLELTLTNASINGKNMVKVEGVHKYDLKNVSLFRAFDEYMEIYTDIGRQGDSQIGGFVKITVDGKTLESSELRAAISYKNHKQYFEYPIKIKRNEKKSFEYHTLGLFSCKDRLIWTVQDLSEDFEIIIINRTNNIVESFDVPDKDIKNEIVFKINHDQEFNINKNINQIHKEYVSNKWEDVYIIKFGYEVLPYQGFEMSWDF
jgi:hypothetical protein